METIAENNSNPYLSDLEYGRYVNVWEDLLLTEETTWEFDVEEWQDIRSVYKNESYLVEKIVKGLQKHDLTWTIVLTGLVIMVSLPSFVIGTSRIFQGDFIFGLVTIPILLVSLFLSIMYSYLLFGMWSRIRDAKFLIRRHAQIGTMIRNLDKQLADS